MFKGFFLSVILLFSLNLHANEDLITATIMGDSAEVSRILSSDQIDINYRDHGGWSAIWYAAYWEYLDIMDMIIAYGDVDVNSSDNSGINLLFLMEYEGKWEVVDRLRAAGAIDID